jgi:Domain of unknown function (DUF4357)
MRHGKTIKLFLIDGDSNGRMACELSNWTGKAYKIPRILVKDSHDRPDLRSTGVYLLFGKDETDTDKVYIGEAEDVYKRLLQHLSSDKDFWHEVIVFTSKDENLNKAHIKYLENRLFDLARKSKRYALDNQNTPTASSISESDRAEMEEFLENIRLLTNTLGHKAFEEKRDSTQTQKDKQEVFYLKGARDADAQGEASVDGFVVYKGSIASLETVKSFPTSLIRLRTKLIESSVIAKDIHQLIFSEDYIFSSPSTAAMIVLGRPANGLLEWKTDNGRTLKSFEVNEKGKE